MIDEIIGAHVKSHPAFFSAMRFKSLALKLALWGHSEAAHRSMQGCTRKIAAQTCNICRFLERIREAKQSSSVILNELSADYVFARKMINPSFCKYQSCCR